MKKKRMGKNKAVAFQTQDYENSVGKRAIMIVLLTG